MSRLTLHALLSLCAPLSLGLTGCGGDGLYNSCESADDCEAPSDTADAACLSGSDGGVCTWSCSTDLDCATDDDLDRVCAPFESEEGAFCFPSCEGEGEGDSSASCPDGFTCRSTGGGDENQQVCFPD